MACRRPGTFGSAGGAPPNVSPGGGERLRVRVDPAQVLLFDQVTEQRVPMTGPVSGADDRQIAG